MELAVTPYLSLLVGPISGSVGVAIGGDGGGGGWWKCRSRIRIQF